jgi:rhodanese-related sulfurtransferase
MIQFTKNNGKMHIGKVLVVSALGLGILVLGGCSTNSSSPNSNNKPQIMANNNTTDTTTGYEDIDAANFKELIKDPNSVVVDVRTQGEYNSGHVAKSLLIPVETIDSNLNKLDKNKTIVLVCRSGRRSSTAAGILVKNGYTKVKNLVGGLSGNPDLIK